jgi:hypothetical protein
MEEVESIMEEMKPVPPPLPNKFGSFSKNWHFFKVSRDIVQWFMEQWILLAYLLREHTIVTPDHHQAANSTASTTKRTGGHYDCFNYHTCSTQFLYISTLSMIHK